MSKIDDLIRRALREEDGGDAMPPESLGGRLMSRFLRQTRWVAGFAWMKMGGCMAICIVAAAFFFSVDSVRAQIAWASTFSAGFVGFAMWWIWYWMLLNRNAALREIKRLELQVAELRATAR